ncbi:MAG: phosphate/phosphite/phosphonate ABC transporter substrate-binding protein [Chloroflexi bacterium]|nr:phosphate/phosphite/phosphonate ABC transporter substrate-binding protein [Chloroflexota bacterium]
MNPASLPRKILLVSLISLLLFSLLFSLSAAIHAQDDGAGQRTTIILSDIDDNAVEVIELLQPLADYLAVGLADFGIDAGDVMVAPNMETMITWLADHEVDVLFDSPYPAMVMRQEAGAVPVLRRWKDGVEAYHSVFFAMQTSDLTSIEDLQGQVVAFDSPQSTSGYMLPKAYLLEAGLTPVEAAEPNANVADDEIGYIFTESDETTIQWVISGRVAAGVVDNNIYAEIPEGARQRMVILAETIDVPRHVVILRPGMDRALQEAIMELLANLDEDEAGQAILEGIETARFDQFPEGPEAALDKLQNLFDLVQD